MYTIFRRKAKKNRHPFRPPPRSLTDDDNSFRVLIKSEQESGGRSEKGTDATDKSRGERNENTDLLIRIDFPFRIDRKDRLRFYVRAFNANATI